MRLDDHLTVARLLDCHGHVTHTFTVLLDGTVRVAGHGRDVVVDPCTRRLLTPGAHLPPELIDHACTVALDAFR